MITVVSGLPRSGTSLMMQMLEQGGMPILTDGIRAADFNNPKGYYEFEKVKFLRTDNTWMQAAEDKAIKIIAQLLYFLPTGHEYRILFMERSIDEIVNSQNRMLRVLGEKGAALEPEILKTTFIEQVEQVKKWLAETESVQLMSFSFKSILENPVIIAGQVRDFISMDLNVSRMASVVDPGMYRSRSG